MAINCDPKALQNAAACFSECIPPGNEKAVMIYLLAQILNAMTGASTDPKVILQAATASPNSFMTLFGIEDAVMMYLLCQIAQASGA